VKDLRMVSPADAGESIMFSRKTALTLSVLILLVYGAFIVIQAELFREFGNLTLLEGRAKRAKSSSRCL
jgi:hypothetical protein